MTATLQLLIVCLACLAALRATLQALAARNDTTLAVARVEAAARLRTPPAGKAPLRTGNRVTVHTKQPDDQAIHGVLVGDYEDRLVLEHADYLTPRGPVPLPGRQDIRTADVAWLDVHGLVEEVPAAPPAHVVEPQPAARPADEG